jgi:leader peptidase (prepilin peptidase) / N-methyltransferase
MNYLIYIFIFVLGSCVGSFINALVYRLKTNQSVARGRSMCPHCRHVLAWNDLFPLFSFLFLRARCRYCRAKISWQYPVVEFITGVLFVIVFLAIYQFNNLTTAGLLNCQIVKLLAYWIFISFLTIIFLYDLKYYLILDQITIPAMAIALLFQVFRIIYYQLPITNYQLLFLSAILGGGFFLIQFLVSKGRWIGGGDIRLGFLMGLILGWPNILVGLFLSYILGSVVGLILIGLKKKQFGSEIPFGTFLTLGTFIALLWSEQLIHWYLTLFLF